MFIASFPISVSLVFSPSLHVRVRGGIRMAYVFHVGMYVGVEQRPNIVVIVILVVLVVCVDVHVCVSVCVFVV